MTSAVRVALGVLIGIGFLIDPASSDAAGRPKSRAATTTAASANAGASSKKASTKKATTKKASSKTTSKASSKTSVSKKKRPDGASSKKATSNRKRSRRASKGGVGGRARATGKHSPTVEVRAEAHVAALAILSRAIECPDDMVAVAGRVCVDRFETSLVDVGTDREWSPFYTPDLGRARDVFAFYDAATHREGGLAIELAPPLPPVPDFAIHARAMSRADVLPQGYLSANQAESACNAAGKRLCSEAEWLTACKGEEVRDFPYGDRYEQGTCNVFRESHPSFLLHGNAARYHDDPRNHLVEIGGRTFLQKTGSASRCGSQWGEDAVMDMVGNLDEWVADENGVFVGGFYSRGTRSGCYARVSAHVRGYSDYSTGARCCKDPNVAP